MNDSISKFIGIKIKAKREVCDITQKILGEQLDVTSQQVQKYESGENKISALTLFKISQILKSEISEFFPINLKSSSVLMDARRNNENEEENTDEKELKELAKIFFSIKKDSKKQLIKIAKIFLEEEKSKKQL